MHNKLNLLDLDITINMQNLAIYSYIRMYI